MATDVWRHGAVDSSELRSQAAGFGDQGLESAARAMWGTAGTWPSRWRGLAGYVSMAHCFYHLFSFKFCININIQRELARRQVASLLTGHFRVTLSRGLAAAARRWASGGAAEEAERLAPIVEALSQR